jgi:hypothetical protein
MNLTVLARDQLRGLLAGQLRPLPGFYREWPNGASVAFVHINKTGGTSVAKAFGLQPKCHLTLREMRPKLSEERWSRAVKCAFVRNPWDRAVSHYEYRIQTNQTDMAKRRPTFDEWLRRVYVDRDPQYYDQRKMFQSQSDWLRDEQGDVALDFIGRFEDFGQEFDKLAAQLGVSAELPHLNRTKRDAYHRYYSPESVDIITRSFAEDIERFGYSF